MIFGSSPHARPIASFIFVVALPALAWSCARDAEPQTPYVQGGLQYGSSGFGGQPAGYPAGGGTSYGQPVAGGAPIGGVPGTVGTPVPSASTPTPAPGTSPTPIDPAAAVALQPVINELSRAHTVAGSKPVGSPIVANFQTGQKLESTIQLQPQKCYTIVATSLPPVTELNIQLLASTPLPTLSPVLAVDSETGPTAVIGKKPNCYKWAFPVPAPAKLVIEVAAGSGLAAAQVYEK